MADFSRCVAVSDYIFPPDDLIYNEEDREIIEQLIIYLKLSKGRIISDPYFDNICTRWQVSNNIGYIDYFYGSFNYERRNDGIILYGVFVEVLDVFTYSVTLNGVDIGNARQYVLDWLRLVNGNIVQGGIERVNLRTSIEAPATSNITHIGNLLNEVWETIWYEFGGMLTEDIKVIWVLEDTLSLAVIGDTQSYLQFSRYTQNEFQLVVEGKNYRFNNNLPDTESIAFCISFLRTWIDNIRRPILYNKLDSNWDMESETYTNYIQWLPREVLSDVKELI